MRRFGYFVLGAATGGFLGSVLAMLLSPASGSQIRSDLKNRGWNVINEVKKAASEKRLTLENEINQLRFPD